MRNLENLLNAKKIIMYGAGNQYKYCFQFIREKTKIPIITVDSNQSKWGTATFFGEEIYSPENAFVETEDCNVIISTISHQYEIACEICKKCAIPKDRLYMYTSTWYEDKVYDSTKIEQHMKDIDEVSKKLGDEESREYYLNAVKARLERQPLYLKPNINALYGEYKNQLVLSQGDRIVDCGAYTGDTAKYYIKKLDGNCKVHAIEPFKNNYDKLNSRVKENHWENIITTYNCAVGKKDEQGELIYNDDDFGMAINLSNSFGEKHQKLDIKSLDTLFPDEKVDYIKMDIEGEENGALLGGRELIRRCSPKIMISAYHKIEDFWEIPNTVWNINPEYRIYVGHAPGVSTEMEYYCVIR